MKVRVFQAGDLEELKRITIEGFEGTAIDERAEMLLGVLSDRDWRWRKSRHVDDDVMANPTGVFVAEEEGKIFGYISTRLDHDCGRGRIPNLAVDRLARGRGFGRQLIEHALSYFRQQGMTWAVIETMDNNPIGQRLYPSCGFVETCRQIHFARKL